MNLLISTAVVMVTGAFSNVIAKSIPAIPATYINLIIGILIGIIPLTNHLVLGFDSDIFMIMILAPLLFFEGQSTTILMIKNKIKSILGTAVGLAFVSAILVTLMISKISTISFPIALIIAALSAPTDATAFESVRHGRKIRPAMKNALKMEALFNDATGIILLQAGVLWLNTGHLPLFSNLTIFLKMALGGCLVGILTGLVFITIRQTLVHSKINVISSQTLLYLISPFIIYGLAEMFDTSGIIAVVVAGLIHNSEAHRSRFSAPSQIHFGIQIGSFINELLSGSVFVILGISLERIVSTSNLAKVPNNWVLVGMMVYIGLVIVRYFYGKIFSKDHQRQMAIIFALGGVHGTVTLAMTFSLIKTLSLTQFNYVILVESVVIILSMVIPSIAFKFILKKDMDELIHQEQINNMRQEMVQIGLNALDELDLSPMVKQSVLYDIQDQNQGNNLKEFFRQWWEISQRREVLSSLQSVEQRRALMHAFDAQRNYLYDLAKRHVVNSEYVYELYSEILLSESLVLDPRNEVI